MGRNRMYTVSNLKEVVRSVNVLGIEKREAIKQAGFNTRQSYYNTLRSLNYEEVLTFRKVREMSAIRKYKRKYTLDHLKSVVSGVNKGKMKKYRAIEAAGFRSRVSYYATLAFYGYEEIYEVEPFSYEALESGLPVVSFL